MKEKNRSLEKIVELLECIKDFINKIEKFKLIQKYQKLIWWYHEQINSKGILFFFILFLYKVKIRKKTHKDQYKFNCN